VHSFISQLSWQFRFVMEFVVVQLSLLLWDFMFSNVFPVHLVIFNWAKEINTLL